jgi:hypothetical protein
MFEVMSSGNCRIARADGAMVATKTKATISSRVTFLLSMISVLLLIYGYFSSEAVNACMLHETFA